LNDAVRTPIEWRRRIAESAAWIAAVGFLWTIDTLSKLSIREQTGYGKDDFRLFTDQGTSAAAALLMIPFVIYWLKLFPLKRAQWIPAIIGHTFGSIIFAFGHYSLMVLFRVIVFAINGMQYAWVNSYAANLIVEYQLDIKIYVGIVLIITTYGLWRRPRVPAEQPAPLQGRIVVQTGTGESIVRLEDIDYLEASRNYVVVHAGSREYLLRNTINSMEKQLAGDTFIRTHRGYIVNVDRIREIKAVDSGHRILLRDGQDIPLSRSYRDAIRSRIAG
jgi:hypothetical protein